jgi:hypothetical protein
MVPTLVQGGLVPKIATQVLYYATPKYFISIAQREESYSRHVNRSSFYLCVW